MKWSEKDDAILKKLVDAGYSSSQIALQFSVTRNSVIGRCHRLGLKLGVNRGASERAAKAVETRKLNQGALKITLAALRAPTPPPVAIKPVPVKAEVIGLFPPVTETPVERSGSGVLFLDRTSFQCAWIDGDPRRVSALELTCCGQKVVTGRSYCARHLKVSLSRPSTPAQKEHARKLFEARANAKPKPSRLTLMAAE